MNCSHCKRNIYLLSEISEKEKLETMKHMTSCASCSLVYNDYLLASSMAKNAFAEGLSAKTELTDRIMSGVISNKRVATKTNNFGWFDLQPVRYAFVGLSLVLLIFFAYELPESRSLVAKNKRVPEARNITVDQKFFTDALSRASITGASRNNISLQICLKACRENDPETCNTCIERYTKN